MKNNFLSNILLMVLWVDITGEFNAINFAFGFILGYLTLYIITLEGNNPKYFTLMPKLIGFFFFFLFELLKANLQVAFDVITPKFYMTPGIVRLPLEAKTDLEITSLANLITLTPGTLSLDVSDDRKVLYVHSMYIGDKEEFIKNIKNGFERRLLEILR